ncbi:MAG: FAD-binding oxidoreductase, partial [Candidatus Obscuribacterales bacterium]|nr:FAD-binding oxidoreductase [Candidatus Obscuribacterales bacterium]
MKADRLLKHLQDLLGSGKVCFDTATLEQYAHDYWMLDLQRRIHGLKQALPLCVVHVENEADISALLAFASRERVAVVPYGAGSGVCAGAKAGRAAIVLSLRRMNRVIELNEKALTVTVQPGMIGAEFEAYLNKRGYSMGHFPQSIALSSVGGWVATRASGQYSSKYGSIENMLVCLKAVLADGSVISTKNAPRAACGPNLNELFLGSEGTLAVLSEITYRIHPLPEKESKRAFAFNSMAEGLDAVRKIMWAGYKPALCRLYDPIDADRHFGELALQKKALLMLL